ncbi:MAG: hypothetical protein JNK64_30695 [Myxococcales bacterium]|nr:hypothetical protein [Myxococcales bacterium]
MVGARILRTALRTSPLLALLACADQPGEPAGPPAVTTGEYHAFIQHGWRFPATQSEWRAIGFDLDRDGVVENLGGSLIGALGAIGLPIDDANAAQLASGDQIVGHVIRADRLDRDASVAWQLWTSRGAPPTYDGRDVVAPTELDGELAGAITAGTLRAHWGDAAIHVPLFPGQPPVAMPLTDAQLELTVDGPCHGMIGGALDAAGYQGVLDQVAAETLAHMAAHPDHEFTRLARDVFDDDNDGVVSAAEVVKFGRELLPPDLDLDDDGRNDALSIGFAFECAPARLAAPPTF